MRFNLSVKIIFALILFSVSISAQNFSSENQSDSERVIGLIKYEGYSFLVTSRGIKSAFSKTTDEKFTEYYKKIYGKDAENPNHVIEGKREFSFIPILNEKMLRKYGIDSVDGLSIRDFYDINKEGRGSSGTNFVRKIENKLIKYIKDSDENIKK